jgi:hypothetical protein
MPVLPLVEGMMPASGAAMAKGKGGATRESNKEERKN